MEVVSIFIFNNYYYVGGGWLSLCFKMMNQSNSLKKIIDKVDCIFYFYVNKFLGDFVNYNEILIKYI